MDNMTTPIRFEKVWISFLDNLRKTLKKLVLKLDCRVYRYQDKLQSQADAGWHEVLDQLGTYEDAVKRAEFMQKGILPPHKIQ